MYAPGPALAPAPAPAPMAYAPAPQAYATAPVQSYGYGSYGSYYQGGYGGGYGAYPVAPLQASTANPFVPQSWSSEDAAEHALNLAEYRVRILRSKVNQAKLRKQLLELSTLPETKADLDCAGCTEQQSGPVALAPTLMGGAATQSSANAAALAGMKQDLVNVAKKTVSALSELKHSIAALKHRQRADAQGMLAEAASGFKSRSTQMLRARDSRGRGGGERVSQAEAERRKEEVDQVRRDTQQQLQRLEEAVGHVAREREEKAAAQKKALLSSLSQRLHSQVSSLESTVNNAVASREEAAEAAEKGAQLRARKQLKQREEKRELTGSIEKLKHKAERAVAEGTQSARDKKVDTILSVKRKADEQLDGLLAKVDRAIARKEWKRSMVDDPALNHS